MVSVAESGVNRSPRLRGGWSDRLDYLRRKRRRRVRGIVFSLLAIVLGAAFMFLLIRPLLHPNTHAVVLSGSGYRPFQVPPLPFSQDDQASLGALKKSLYGEQLQQGPTRLPNLRSVEAMADLGTDLVQSENGPRDALILFVSAHGVSDGDGAFLLCDDFNSRQVTQTRWSIAQLLEQVGQSQASVKLLLLDTGWLHYDPRLGVVLNEFPHLLEQAVHQQGDESLWVLTAHSAMEKSLFSSSLRHSLYGFFVGRGLRGAADLDHDEDVDVGELFRYVSANVDEWASQSNDGLATQTPLLIWGGGSLETRRQWPTLLSVAPLEAGSSGQGRTSGGSRPASAGIPTIAQVIETNRKQHPPVLFPEPPPQQVRPQSSAAESQPPAPTTPQQGGSSAAPAAKSPAGGQSDSGSTSTTPGEQSFAGTQTSNSESVNKATTNAASNGTKSSSPSKATTAGETTSNSSTGKSSSTNKNGGKPGSGSSAGTNPSTAELIVESWSLRDALVKQKTDGANLIELAPHLVRALERTLLNYELRVRGGNYGEAQTKAVLEHLVEAARTPTTSAAPQDPTIASSTLEEFSHVQSSIIAAWTKDQLPAVEAHSASLARLLEETQHEEFSLAGAMQQFDQVFTTGTRSEAVKFLASANRSGIDRFVEVKFARRVMAAGDIPWTLVQRAVQTRRLAEQAAAAQLWCTPWIQAKVDAADQLRVRAELELFYRTEPAWQQRVADVLKFARDGYQSAVDDVETIRQARQLRVRLLHRAPYYVHWHADAKTSYRFGPDADDISQLLTTLGQFDQVLAQPAPENVVTAQRLHTQLLQLQFQVEANVSPTAVALLREAIAPGDVYRCNALLSTPLLSTAPRMQLLNFAMKADEALAVQIRLPEGLRVTPRVARETPQAWRWMLRQLELELQLLEFTRKTSPDAERKAAALHAQREAASKAYAVYVKDPTSAQARDALRISFRAPGQGLANYYEELPEWLEDLVSPSNSAISGERFQRDTAYYAADTALYFVDPRDALRLGGFCPYRRLRDDDVYDLLAWQRQRALAEANASPPTVAEDYRGIARQYAADAGMIPDQPPLPQIPASGLRLEAASSVSLALEGSSELVVSVSRISGPAEPVWLFASYNEQLLELSTDGRAPLRGLPVVPHTPSSPPTFQLEPGLPETIRLQVRRVPQAAQSPKLVLTAVTKSAVVRQAIDIWFPRPETVALQVSGKVAGTWEATAGSSRLLPFPNRSNSYTLSLLNRGPNVRTLDVNLIALDQPLAFGLPHGAVSPDDAQMLLGRMANATTLAEMKSVKLNSGASAVALPFPQPKSASSNSSASAASSPSPESSSAAPAASAGESKSGDAAGADSGSSSSKPPPPTADGGLLLTLADVDSGWTSFHLIQIEPTTPDRFLTASVDYDYAQEHFSINVSPRENVALPAGDVKLDCRIVAVDSHQTIVKHADELTPPRYRASPRLKAPHGDNRLVRVELDVDGFPRAFVYRFRCDRDALDIPEGVVDSSVRVISPKAGTAYPGGTESISATVEVDVPPDAFLATRDEIEVGIDRRRDRVLTDDPRVQLRRSRDVQLQVTKLGPKGALVVQPSVSDLHLDLPTSQVQNLRGNVLAVARVEGKTAWSEPVEVVFDGTPPVLESTQLTPDRIITAGESFALTIEADDPLSGVKTVQAAIDVTGDGEFSTTNKPVKAAQQPDGTWAAAIPTANVVPGNHDLLVQAIDRVGNAGEIKRIQITVLSKEQAAARQAAMTVTIEGVVTYGDSPQSDIDVEVQDAKGKVIGKAMTNEQGNFKIGNIPPGKYKVTAKGTVRNRERTVDQSLTINPGAPPDTLNLKLPP